MPAPSPLRLIAAGLLLLLAGCTSPDSRLSDLGPAYTPANVRGPAVWPAAVRRVAVLPAHDASVLLTPEFTARYDGIWNRALNHTQRAEFVGVSRSNLSAWTGSETLASTALLPSNLLGRVARETGAQAVLFLDLTHCTPYPPLALSFRARP
ncbi:MAG: hypothetical protein PHE72_14865, partial [candidate division Zixibacteria bacterium]|nr:hypothetical protein [candidate division Zixibacteria bacterium]